MEGESIPDAAPIGKPLPSGTEAYRALTDKRWIDKVTRKVTPAAFFRRKPPKDADGISIGHSCTLASYLPNLPVREVFGAVALQVDSVRTLGIDVHDSCDPEDPHHGAIVGVPYREENTLRAESLADALARQAGPVLQG